jgi:hypothetical protein
MIPVLTKIVTDYICFFPVFGRGTEKTRLEAGKQTGGLRGRLQRSFLNEKKTGLLWQEFWQLCWYLG